MNQVCVFICLLAVLVDCSPSAGQSTAGDSRNSIRPAAASLGFQIAQLNEIDAKMKALVEAEEVVGCSSLILKDGQEVYYGQWGMRDREKKRPISRDTIFRIYSMTKPITSVAVMQLVERGKLDLDVPVGQYLPDLAELEVLEKQSPPHGDSEFEQVPAKRAMTARDLLRHTSGLTYGFFGNSEVDQRYRRAGILMSDKNIAETVEKLGSLPLRHHPGSEFLYSVSTDVAGRLVEVVANQTFDTYLQENIFEPLNMQDTSFMVPKSKQDRFAQLYKPDNDGKLVPASAFSSMRFLNESNQYFSGGGGLCSTIDDYLKFCQMLLGNGRLDGKQILRPATLQQMFTNQLDTIERPPGQFKFGLGFALSDRGDVAWGGAAGTRFWVNPDKQLAILFMIQINPYGRRAHGDLIRDIAYAALEN